MILKDTVLKDTVLQELVPHKSARQDGFSMLEVLVTLFIIMLGILGLIGLQARMHTASFESYQRVQALNLVNFIVDTMQVNRSTANCFDFTTNADGTPFVGVGGTLPAACAISSAAANTMADAAIAEWDGLLTGASEVNAAATQVGAIVGARGCVSYDATTELLNPVSGAALTGTGVFTVTVAWQGKTETVAPAVNCGNGLYGVETLRRALPIQFRFARLG
jgi:type IV pilus assembly protein PilV